MVLRQGIASVLLPAVVVPRPRLALCLASLDGSNVLLTDTAHCSQHCHHRPPVARAACYAAHSHLHTRTHAWFPLADFVRHPVHRLLGSIGIHFIGWEGHSADGPVVCTRDPPPPIPVVMCGWHMHTLRVVQGCHAQATTLRKRGLHMPTIAATAVGGWPVCLASLAVVATKFVRMCT